MENRITMDDFGVTHIFGNFHIFPLTFETQKAHDFHWFPHINITLLNCQKTSKGEDRWRMLEWLTMLRKAFWLYILKVAIEWETWWSTMEFWGALFYDVWGPVAATEAKPRGLADIQVAFVCLLHAFCFVTFFFELHRVAHKETIQTTRILESTQFNTTQHACDHFGFWHLVKSLNIKWTT
jgi:hypothetical protein